MIYGIGVTSQTVDVFVADGNGNGVSGLNASTFPAVYWSLAGPNPNVTIALSNLGSLTAAWSAGGLFNRKGGWYRLDLPDAVFVATGMVTLVADETADLKLMARDIQVGIPGTNVVITPSDPDLVTGYLTVYDEFGAAEPGAVISLHVLISGVPTGLAYDSAVRTATSDGAGLVQFPNMFKGVAYHLYRGTGVKKIVSIPLAAGSTYQLPSIVGAP